MDYPVLNKAPNAADAFVPHVINADATVSPVGSASAGGVPLPTSAAPSPAAASDASSTIASGGTAQTVFGATVPTNGWAVYNPDASETLWVSDTTTAAANAVGSIPVFAGSGYETPPGRKPIAAVSIVGATTGHKFTASRW